MDLQVGLRKCVTIEDIAFGGEGVARIDNFVIFVPFVLPGEEVEIELTEVKKSFARGKLTRINTPSSFRVSPECPYFGRCGGCQYQQIDYPRQLEYKRKQVADLFERVGGFNPGIVSPVLPCPSPYGYRNRIMIRSQWNKPEQRLNIGFVRHDGGLVEDIEECRIAEPGLNELIREVRNNPPPRGGIKIELRMPLEDWEVGPGSFFQNNFHLLPGLVDTVRTLLKKGGSKHLVDVYCGVGFFGIELAPDVESFIGVEYDQQAIKSARRNATRHQAQNGEFVAGKAEELLPSLLDRFQSASTTAIIDPPRKGCLPATIDALCRARPAQIIYISCHPATMARDLKLLCDRNYRLETLIPLDMFPQTQHVECVADLRVTCPESNPS